MKSTDAAPAVLPVLRNCAVTQVVPLACPQPLARTAIVTWGRAAADAAGDVEAGRAEAGGPVSCEATPAGVQALTPSTTGRATSDIRARSGAGADAGNRSVRRDTKSIMIVRQFVEGPPLGDARVRTEPAAPPSHFTVSDISADRVMSPRASMRHPLALPRLSF